MTNSSERKEIIDNIVDFLKDENPEKYDFKRLMRPYYEKNKKQFVEKFGDEYNAILEELPYYCEEDEAIKQFLAYKIAKKKGIGFDPDNWNYHCKLTGLVYKTLWSWKNNSKPVLIWDEQKNEFGGDGMNSFATTFNKYIDIGKRTSIKNYKEIIEGHTGCKVLDDDKWNKFARNASCIGNFVLVPYRFNGYRGVSSKIQDYWDLSLDCIAYDKDKKGWLCQQCKSTEEREKILKKYINTFFLWDYVEKDEDRRHYKVKPLFSSHEKKLGPDSPLLSSAEVFPKGDDFDEFLENVNKYIEKRGLFMVAMLRIALLDVSEDSYSGKHKEKWRKWDVSDIYKYIMEKFFLTDTVYSDYEDVIEKIKNEIQDGQVEKINDGQRESVINILEELKSKLGTKK